MTNSSSCLLLSSSAARRLSQSQDQEPGHCSLIALPDACLLEVLQLCAANDLRSVFSAARAHSRLHQAAAAVSSVTADLSQQEQVDSVLLYLDRHSRYVNSIELRTLHSVILQQLPPSLQLNSLQLQGLRLQVLPAEGFQGVLGAAAAVAALKQLQLTDCTLTDDEEGLTAALSPLAAALEHLSISDVCFDGQQIGFPTAVLRQMQQLTYLELASVCVGGGLQREVQDLQALTRLVDLRLCQLNEGGDAPIVTERMLSGMQGLTRLEFCQVVLEPGALAGKPKLQHLNLIISHTTGALHEGTVQLLSRLQDLQQLTHLDLTDALSRYEWAHPADEERVNPPASAYAALTASSKLQYLDVSSWALPFGAWQHIFPAGKQLPHLQTLLLFGMRGPSGLSLLAPDGLVSCCPGLQHLDMRGMQRGAQLLPSLQGLSVLHTLRLSPASSTPEDLAEAEGFVAACQLTGLRDLTLHTLYTPATREGLLRPLTQLQQLTKLEYGGARRHRPYKNIILVCEVSPNSIVCADLV